MRNPIRNIRVVIFVASFLCGVQTIAQPQYRFEHYRKKDGLGHDLAWSLAQDSLGYIWIQYQGVLSRFDGHTFNVYKYDAKDSLRSVIDFWMGHLIKDFSGNIWIPQHNLNGKLLVKYNRKSDSFTKYLINLDKTGVSQWTFDMNGAVVWAGGQGLFRFSFEDKKVDKYLNKNLTQSSRPFVANGIKDLGHSLFLSSNHGLWLFNKSLKTFERPPCNPSDTLMLFNTITRLLINSVKDRQHTWLLTGSGRSLIKVDSTYSITHRFDLPDGVFVGANKHDIDKDGIIWFGGSFESKTGLFRYDPRDQSLINLKHDPNNPKSLASDIVYDVLVDSDQNVWVATDHGVSVWRRPALTFYNKSIQGGTLYACGLYKSNDAEYLVINNVYTSTATNINQIMMARLTPGKPDSINFQPVLSPIKNGFVQHFYQGQNHFWAVQWPQGITGYPIDRKTGMFKENMAKVMATDRGNPMTIHGAGKAIEDSAGNLLVATGSGIDEVTPSKNYGTEGSVRHIEPPKSGENLIHKRNDNSYWVTDMLGKRVGLFHQGSDSIERIFELNDIPLTVSHTPGGTLLIGAQNGLYEAVLENGKYNLKSEPIIPKVEANAIQFDRLGRLWLYADARIICYDKANNITTVFGEEDGIENCTSFYTDWLLQTTEGLMITAGPNGVTVFDPSTFTISRNEVTPVLTDLAINNTRSIGQILLGDNDFRLPANINVMHELVLDYRHNNFSIEFSAMEMTAPEKNLYQHMLDGYDPDWIETDNRNRTATYTNLPAATYTFRVKASNHHGIWSDNERTLKVIILPPPWRTWWAYTGYGLLVVGLLYWARSNLVQRERLKANLAMAKVEQEKEHFELEKAKEVDKVKTSFFTNISHEFRTPLTLIKGPVQNIIEQFLNGQKDFDRNKIVDQLKLVQRNSDLLLKLINQLLDLAKLESGSLKVEKSEADVFSFVRAIASSFESFARQKNVSVQIKVPEGSCHALVDKDKVETILINLINNAIKFTSAGGEVIVSIVNQQLSTNNHQLTLSVRDTGIGIPPEQQTKIFERFHQVSEAHKEVGTGIGLALVKELVALMGGEISVTSEVGKGSEFRVLLPIEVISEEFQIPSSRLQYPISEDREPETWNQKSETVNNGDLSKPQVLVVEDNTDLRHFIIDSLGNEFQFLEAENGRQGLEKATREVPDLIISDVMMPEMDGITMAEKIKKDIRSSHIPLILLTAKSTEDSKLHGLASGADDYLTKPFNKNELLLKVRNGVTRQLKLRERLRAELMSTAPKIEVLSEDEKFLNSVKEKILERLSDEQLSVESLADDMGMSRVQLYRKISGLTDISVNELIRKLRLQRASQLLQQNWGPVSQVAYEVGFSNLSYFSKVFKEEFGVLPSEYAGKT